MKDKVEFENSEFFGAGILNAFDIGYETAPDGYDIRDPVAKAILMGSILIAQQNTRLLAGLIEEIRHNHNFKEISDTLKDISYQLSELNKRPIGRGKKS